ncbi:uncharacterized protein LOC132553115 [Ylistrum balloti]|uniref:uncharacterized protein LOC132553115 n=1 Tax=Ylistrum balloti TaxID=509963 RepID=UPI002905A79F|nr:uncharacterized protein LOC132553115 [Ylistrum balloti]
MATTTMKSILCMFYFLVCTLINVFQNIVTPNCAPDVQVCRLEWTIDYKQTMTYYGSDGIGHPIVSNNGTFRLRDTCQTSKPTTEKDLENVLLTDGLHKLIYTINGQYPGPTVVVYQGQQVEVVVKNKLLSEGVTIHWHGLIQRGTPWMDGVGSLSHCPINPMETFVYSFLADPVGSHWYHSHHGPQRTEGLAGALIVLKKQEEEQAGEVQKTEYLMFLQDWFHRSSTELNKFLDWGMIQFFYGLDNDQCSTVYFGADQENVGFIPLNAILINGKGNTFLTDMTTNSAQQTLETFHVTVNSTYRFRLVNAAMTFPLLLSVDQHEVEVVAVDGNEIVGVKGDAVIINTGERLDMLIRTYQQVSSYWIRVSTLANNQPDKTLGLLHYEGSDTTLPVTESTKCNATRRCRVVNCLFGKYPDDLYTDCVSLGAMKSTPEEIKRHPVSVAESLDTFQEIFLNFHYTRGTSYPFPTSVSGKKFIRPSVPLQLLPTANDTYIACENVECRDICDCTNIVKLGINNTIQLVLHNMDESRNGLSHGIHIHGHHVHVLKVGYPNYNSTTGRISEQNSDILCDTPTCNNASWRDQSWSGGQLPGANFEDPPLKDTILVPRQGYVVVRFKADNPGFWYMHCHMEPHQISGMTLILQEGDIGQMPRPPAKLPRCGNFFSDMDSADLSKAKNSLLKNAMPSDQIRVIILSSTATLQPCGSVTYLEYFKKTKAKYVAAISVLSIFNAVTLVVLYITVKCTAKKGYNNRVRYKRIEINERTEAEAFRNHVDKQSF